jgi:hypothetical protein
MMERITMGRTVQRGTSIGELMRREGVTDGGRGR